MKKKITVTIVVVIVALALAIAAYIYRDKIKSLFNRSDNEPVPQPQAPTVADSVPAPSAPVYIASASADNGVSYNKNDRTITVDGVMYKFYTKQDVENMQMRLMQVLSQISGYKYLAEAMQKAGGADGIIGKATANAFAIAARKRPDIVSTYRA